MKHSILFALVILISINCYSRQKIKKKHLTYTEYINEYGDNKTSITIINIFFQKREYAGIGKMSFLPISTAVTIVFPPIGVGLMTISSPLFVSGIVTRNKYSHKNLLKTLQEYRANKTLAKGLKRKIIRIHIIEQEIYEMELAQNNFDALKALKSPPSEKNHNKNTLSLLQK